MLGRWRLLGSLLAPLAAAVPAPLPAQVRESGARPAAGVAAVAVAGSRWFSGLGAQVLIPATRPIRFSLLGAAGARGRRAGVRVEASMQLAFEPARRRRGVVWYLGGGLAGEAAGETRGYLLMAAGLEGPVGRRGQWWLEGGVGGGVRVAAGYRWRPRGRR